MAPAELEAVLLRHPDVTDTAVIGLPDDVTGVVPAEFVVLRCGAAACAGCSANLLGPDPLSLCRPGPICPALL